MAPIPNRPALWWFVGLLAVIQLALLTGVWPWLQPPCGLRFLTGLPCPLCGSTRALQALATGHWRTALVLNPLTTLAALGIAGWFLAWLVGSLVGRNRFVPSDGRRRFLRQLWPWVALGGVTLNWAWLLFMASSPS